MKRFGLGHLPRIVSSLSALLVVMVSTGCMIACGPIRTVPAQKVCIVAPAPSDYAIRVVEFKNRFIDTAVPASGRVAFEVPVSSRYCRSYLLGFIPLNSPTPVEERKVIYVMHSEAIVRKLSANDIGQLEADAEGYRILKISR